MCVYLSGDNGIIRETTNGNPADRTPLLAREGSDQRGKERGEGAASVCLLYRFLCFNGILLF